MPLHLEIIPEADIPGRRAGFALNLEMRERAAEILDRLRKTKAGQNLTFIASPADARGIRHALAVLAPGKTVLFRTRKTAADDGQPALRVYVRRRTKAEEDAAALAAPAPRRRRMPAELAARPAAPPAAPAADRPPGARLAAPAPALAPSSPAALAGARPAPLRIAANVTAPAPTPDELAGRPVGAVVAPPGTAKAPQSSTRPRYANVTAGPLGERTERLAVGAEAIDEPADDSGEPEDLDGDL